MGNTNTRPKEDGIHMQALMETVGASAQGWLEHGGRWSGKAVNDMRDIGAAATWGHMTFSCSLFDPKSPSQCWGPVAPFD